jgi:septal ring factor EnvC (AmiA/AmiB activator)
MRYTFTTECICMRYLLISLFAVMLVNPLIAQSKKNLQEKKNKLQNDINYTNKLLKDTQKQAKSSLNQIEKLQKNIETRVELINTFQSEIELLNKDIIAYKVEIEKKNKVLTKLKEQYAEMAFNAWLKRNTFDKIMYVFSAKNFNQGLRRLQYFSQISDIRKQRLNEIKILNEKLRLKVNELNGFKQEKTVSLNEQTEQAKKLENDKKEKEQLVSKLKTKEKGLKEKIKKKEKEKIALEAKIKAIIEKEIRELELKKAKEKTKTTSTTTTKTSSSEKSGTTSSKTTAPAVKETPSGNVTASGFLSNKGLLPWPVEKGVITGKFGVQPHPVLSSIEIKNDGIDITTDRGASVRSVYKGEVTGVFKVDGYENVVIIRHGEYLTVYSNLSSVSVSKGMSVNAKQKIGTVATDDEGKTCLNFQVRLGSAVQNPMTWLSR